jgi:hypothetical protein
VTAAVARHLRAASEDQLGDQHAAALRHERPARPAS